MQTAKTRGRVEHQVFHSVELLLFGFLRGSMDSSIHAKLGGPDPTWVAALVPVGRTRGYKWQVEERAFRHFSPP